MVFIRTIIKQSDNGIASHVYEHIVGNYLTIEFARLGYQNLLDYELTADTYDGIIVIRLEAYSRRVVNKFNFLLHTLTLDEDKIHIAIEQVQCEYERQEKIDFLKLTKFLDELHSQPWTPWNRFGLTKPIEHNNARMFMTSLGGFGQKTASSFQHFDFTYTIEDCPYELKTLAVYILQIIGLNTIAHLNDELKYFYDTKDEWAEYQTLVGYSHRISVRKSRRVSLETLQSYADKSRTELQTDRSIKKIARYIKRDMAQPFPYFNRESIFAKSYQLMGAAEMDHMATAQNIRTILDKVTIAVAKT